MPQNSATGIERAIKAVGSQEHLAFLLSERLGEKIKQPRISEWLKNGYVPASRAPTVAELTDIPLSDLLRKPKPPKGRNAKGSN